MNGGIEAGGWTERGKQQLFTRPQFYHWPFAATLSFTRDLRGNAQQFVRQFVVSMPAENRAPFRL